LASGADSSPVLSPSSFGSFRPRFRDVEDAAAGDGAGAGAEAGAAAGDGAGAGAAAGDGAGAGAEAGASAGDGAGDGTVDVVSARDFLIIVHDQLLSGSLSLKNLELPR